LTTNTDEKDKPKEREIYFKCKFCSELKPLDDMVTLPGYFPPIVACRDCEAKMR
jgi:hypothetical protein